MSIKEILDYVMHTPFNSNRAVLESQLKQLVEESSSEITDATAVAGDLKKGKIAYNNDGKFTGTFDGVDTKDASATAEDVRTGKTCYVNNQLVTGSFKGVDSSDANATVSDIVRGKTCYVNNVLVTGEFDGIDSKDATAVAEDILAGKTGYINNVKVTGTAPAKEATTIIPNTEDQTVAAGTHLTGILTIKGDINLKAENIKKGVTIFGIEGTYEAGTQA